MNRLFPDFFASDLESDDGSDREDSSTARRNDRPPVARSRRGGTDENDVDEETTAGDIDVETPLASLRGTQSSPSSGRAHRTSHDLFCELDESDADADDSFDYPHGTSDLLTLLDELQIIDTPDNPTPSPTISPHQPKPTQLITTTSSTSLPTLPTTTVLASTTALSSASPAVVTARHSSIESMQLPALPGSRTGVPLSEEEFAIFALGVEAATAET
jgi:hypothetical protein